MDEVVPSRDGRTPLYEPIPETGKKRRRREVAESRKKQRRPAQRGLCELNIDELHIIFAYIYPMDLLNLARACKYLRGILMHKSSLFLWKAALLRVEDLPPCPADLTEPQYTNLVFYARCHGCSKSAHTILWRMRRRYCPACRNERLCSPFSYRCAIPLGWYPSDPCKTVNGSGKRVDRDQLESFVREYNQSSDKTAFLDEKQKKCHAISVHARECEYWQRQNGRVHRHDLELLRKERGVSIFQRLRQHGYEPEIAFVSEESIQRAIPMFFKTYKVLTDNEWNQVWPELVEIMNNFRERRLSQTVHYPRRGSLVSEYNQYVTHRPLNAPTFDLLPHVADLESCFSIFQDVIKGPEEEAPIHGELFTSAFSQLPVLVSEWKKRLDIEVAGLVKIPPYLSLEGMQSSQTLGCGSISSAESHRMDLDKLHLACAVFKTDFCCFAYPEAFLSAPRQLYPKWSEDPLKRVELGIRMLEEAPYIVHACGLDPNVATADDMDRRNARLKCLCCNMSVVIVMDWRSAMLHAVRNHYPGLISVPLSDSPRWQLISDEHISAIQTVEESLKEKYTNQHRRCLLCQPRVGDSWRHHEIIGHLETCHGVAIGSIERGVHYEHLGIMNENIGKVEMVEEGGKVVFRKP